MKPPHGGMRVGRIARWQRRVSYFVLGACAATGLVWFLLLDAAGWPPPRLVPWWIGHGVTGVLTLVVIGSVLPHHVVSTWKHHRNRLLGSLAFAGLAGLAISALLLQYGPEPWHAALHWTHVAIGITALLVFPLHVLRGRTSVAHAIAPKPRTLQVP